MRFNNEKLKEMRGSNRPCDYSAEYHEILEEAGGFFDSGLWSNAIVFTKRFKNKRKWLEAECYLDGTIKFKIKAPSWEKKPMCDVSLANEFSALELQFISTMLKYGIFEI